MSRSSDEDSGQHFPIHVTDGFSFFTSHTQKYIWYRTSMYVCIPREAVDELRPYEF